jgi:2-oxoglutarate dehydrogenase E2 component (dihydrolipoamide succinyltransferase)
VSEGTIAAWFTQPGAAIEKGDPLFELATEKVDSEIPSPVSGTVVEILIPQGGTVRVGDMVITIDTTTTTAPPAAPPTAEAAGTSPPATPTIEAPAAGRPEPAAAAPRQSDLLGAPPLPPMPPDQEPVAPSTERSSSPADLVEPGDGDSFVRFSRIRSVTGKIVSESNATIPQVLSMVEVDHSGIFAARTQAKARGAGSPPTALAFVAVAVARALGEHPILNSSVAERGLVMHSRINLAFAVDTPDGLMAPVVHDADQLTVAGMADAIIDLAERARTKKLSPNQMTGGTFSISNNGSVGSVLTAAIITPPQVAVLSTDRVVDRPVVIERDGSKSIAIRPIGNLAMSWDHRAMDGADAARFLSRVKEIVETTDWSSIV